MAGRVDPSLVYFRDRFAIPRVYQVALDGERDVIENGVRIVPAATFLSVFV